MIDDRRSVKILFEEPSGNRGGRVPSRLAGEDVMRSMTDEGESSASSTAWSHIVGSRLAALDYPSSGLRSREAHLLPQGKKEDASLRRSAP